jgi:hypothetical protein
LLNHSSGGKVLKKNKVALLVAIIIISLIPTLASSAAASISPWRTVWEDPYTLTTYGPDNVVNTTFYTFPKVIWDGSEYVDCILNSSDMSAGIGSVYLKVCSDHTVFYDPYRTEERIGNESWIVEKYNAVSALWETDSPVDNSVYSSVNSSGIYFDRASTLQSGSRLDVFYWLRIGSKLKISVCLQPNVAGEFRLVWSLNGVPATKARWLKTTENVGTELVKDPSCSWVQFADDNVSKCLVDWSDACLYNETADRWVTFFKELEIQKDVSGNLCRAKVSFGDFTLGKGDTLTLDPTLVTFNSVGPVDGLVERYGNSYPPTTGTIVDTAHDLAAGQAYVPGNGDYIICRSYLDFNTSTIPSLAYNMNATLSLKLEDFISVVNFTVNVWGGNQPVCNGNLTILNGVQPIYNTSLTANAWGTGRVKVSTWNTANYVKDIYVNLTIPANQINKVNETEFELNSSREGTPPQPNTNEFIYFYSGDTQGKEPKLQVTYSIDQATVNNETWFFRNVSTNKAAIVLFGAARTFTYMWVRSIDNWGEPWGAIPEKELGKIMFLDALVANGISVWTPDHDNSSYSAYHLSKYDGTSTWVRDLTLQLANQGYSQISIFGMSGGGTVVGNEIQKDYASNFSAAVMNCAPVDENASYSQIFRTASTASNARVRTAFLENKNDSYYNQMKSYYGNETVNKEWYDWMGGHGTFFQANKTEIGFFGDNSSAAVIKWFNGPLCAMKTKTDGYFYVPNNSSIGSFRIEKLFSNSNITGDQTGGSSPYKSMTRYPDGTVNILDQSFVGSKNGLQEGQAGWDYMADVVPDRVINILDLFVISQNFNKNGTYTTDLSGVTVTFNTGQQRSPDANGFVAIPQSAANFTVTRNSNPVGAEITYWPR